MPRGRPRQHIQRAPRGRDCGSGAASSNQHWLQLSLNAAHAVLGGLIRLVRHLHGCREAGRVEFGIQQAATWEAAPPLSPPCLRHPTCCGLVVRSSALSGSAGLPEAPAKQREAAGRSSWAVRPWPRLRTARSDIGLAGCDLAGLRGLGREEARKYRTRRQGFLARCPDGQLLARCSGLHATAHALPENPSKNQFTAMLCIKLGEGMRMHLAWLAVWARAAGPTSLRAAPRGQGAADKHGVGALCSSLLCFSLHSRLRACSKAAASPSVDPLLSRAPIEASVKP